MIKFMNSLMRKLYRLFVAKDNADTYRILEFRQNLHTENQEDLKKFII